MPRYIDSEKLTKALGEKCDGCKDKWTDYCTTCCDVEQLIEMIDNIDDADVVERKKGKWIITDIYNNRVWHCNCSECGEDPIHFISGTEDWWLNKLPDYCPNCGAEMEETDDK